MIISPIGSTENGELIGRYCGNTTLPDPIISPSANLWMRFRTDVSIVDRGFALTYAYTGMQPNSTQSGGICESIILTIRKNKDTQETGRDIKERPQMVIKITDIEI